MPFRNPNTSTWRETLKGKCAQSQPSGAEFPVRPATIVEQRGVITGGEG